MASELCPFKEISSQLMYFVLQNFGVSYLIKLKALNQIYNADETGLW